MFNLRSDVWKYGRATRTIWKILILLALHNARNMHVLASGVTSLYGFPCILERSNMLSSESNPETGASGHWNRITVI